VKSRFVVYNWRFGKTSSVSQPNFFVDLVYRAQSTDQLWAEIKYIRRRGFIRFYIQNFEPSWRPIWKPVFGYFVNDSYGSGYDDVAGYNHSRSTAEVTLSPFKRSCFFKSRALVFSCSVNAKHKIIIFIYQILASDCFWCNFICLLQVLLWWFFLSCKANGRVFNAISGHGPHSLPQTGRLHLSAWQTSRNSSMRQSQSGLGRQTANQPKFIPPIIRPGQARP